jgi:hypothetical protein
MTADIHCLSSINGGKEAGADQRSEDCPPLPSFDVCPVPPTLVSHSRGDILSTFPYPVSFSACVEVSVSSLALPRYGDGSYDKGHTVVQSEQARKRAESYEGDGEERAGFVKEARTSERSSKRAHEGLEARSPLKH